MCDIQNRVFDTHLGLKAPAIKAILRIKTDITHDRVLGISVNIHELRQISHMAVY